MDELTAAARTAEERLQRSRATAASHADSAVTELQQEVVQLEERLADAEVQAEQAAAEASALQAASIKEVQALHSKLAIMTHQLENAENRRSYADVRNRNLSSDGQQGD
eukprot:SAG31_NODE_5669_length_2393_cov_1.883173_4_plen_109_part_00